MVYPAASIYIQPDPTEPGYNPNDEHALFVPSQTGTGINAVFALRSDFGANIINDDSSASDPYVLVKYWNAADAEFKLGGRFVRGSEWQGNHEHITHL